MSSQPSSAKRKRPTEPQTKRKKRSVVDLTEEEQTDQENSSNSENQTMKNPIHLESDDYFEVLRLSRSASQADVKRAYRKLAVQWHPDKNRLNPRAEEFFKKISEAYEVLGDSEKRKAYERYGRTGQGASSRATHEQFRGFSTQHAKDIFDAFFDGSDPFETFFGGSQRRGSQRRGRFEDPFESMGFGGLGMGGFGDMDSFFSDGFMDGPAVFSTSSSSSSTFTDRNGHVVMQKTTTTTGVDGRTETVSEEYRNGRLVNSTASSSASRLAGAGRMQLEGTSGKASLNRQSLPRRGSNDSRPKY